MITARWSGRRVETVHRRLDAVQHQVDGRVPVRVHQDRHAPPDEVRRPRPIQLRVESTVRAVVGRRARRPLVVRLGHPRRPALRRPVEEELDPRDAQPAAVVGLRHDTLGVLQRPETREHGDVGGQRLALGRGSQLPEHVRPDRPVLDRGRAVARVDVDGAAGQSVQVVGGPEQPTASHQPARGLLEHAVGLSRVADPADVAAGRVRGIGGDPRGPERGGVGRAQMPRHVGQHDRVLRRGPVEVVARRVAVLGQQRVVVAAAAHHLARQDVALGDPGPNLAHDVVDGTDVPDRRRVERQCVEGHPHGQEVPVRIDEAGQQRALPQLDDARRSAAQGHHVVAGAGRDDRLPAHRHRLHPRPARLHRDDVIADEDRVRRSAGIRLRGGRAAGGEGHGDRARGGDEDSSSASGHALLQPGGSGCAPTKGTGRPRGGQRAGVAVPCDSTGAGTGACALDPRSRNRASTNAR